MRPELKAFPAMSEWLHEADYQTQGRQFLFDTKACALWWRMGRGKTVTTAMAAADLIDIGLAKRVLVIAPKRVAVKTWPAEFSRWDQLSGVSHVNLSVPGSPARKQRVKMPTDFNFINWELLPWLVENYQDRWLWDMVIVDESSKIKTQGVWWKGLASVRRKIRRIVELTGSPSPNGLLDVWAPIYMLDRGRRLGTTKEAFKDRWFYTDRGGKTHIRGKPAQAEIHHRLHDVVYALRSVVDTGHNLVYNPIPVELPDKYMTEYRQLEREAFLQIDKDTALDAFNAAALTGKLLQYASGAVYTEHPVWQEFHTVKLEVLDDIIQEAEGRPIIVAYNHRHELERILRRYPEARQMDKRGEVVDEWNRGEVPLLVMHPAAGGHGLNMQFGGATIVWFSLTWSLDLFEQLIARLYGRRGQKEDVIVHMMMAEGTLDEEVRWRLEGKHSVQEALMLAMERRRY